MATKNKRGMISGELYAQAVKEADEAAEDAWRTREAAYNLYGALEDLVKLGKGVVVQYTLPSRTDSAAVAFMAGLKKAEEVLAETERVQLQARVEQLMKQLVVQEERTKQLAEIGRALVLRLAKAKLSKDGRGVEVEDMTEYVNLALAIKEVQ